MTGVAAAPARSSIDNLVVSCVPVKADARRLDVVMVERRLAASRERAQALVAAGLVSVDGAPARSVGQAVGPAAEVVVAGRDHPWASRGGLKLEAALDGFGISPSGRVALDAGASTGGFTDVLLARGAALVYAVDVGRGQLDGRLAADPRVTILDRTNLRTLEALPGPSPSLVTLDLSFISLRLVLGTVARLAAPRADVVALFKPQFELGRQAVERGGVVRDRVAAESGAQELVRWAEAILGARGSQPVPAAVRGARGNQEWFIHLLLAEEAV